MSRSRDIMNLYFDERIACSQPQPCEIMEFFPCLRHRDHKVGGMAL